MSPFFVVALLLSSLFLPSHSLPSHQSSLFDDSIEIDEEDLQHVGSHFTHFFSNSYSQMIIDLDLFRDVFDAHAMAKGMQDGNVEAMKDLMKVVDKLRKMDISAACLADVFHIVWSAVEYATVVQETNNSTTAICHQSTKQMKNERQWIFDVLDGWGKVPAGVMGGNNLWVGSWKTCRKVNVVKNTQGQRWKGQYCLTRLYSYNRDNPLKAMVPSGPVDQRCFSNHSETAANVTEDNSCFTMIPLLNFGLCMPETCTNYDVRQMVVMGMKGVESGMGRDLVCNVAVECRSESEERAAGDSPAVTAALLLLTFLCIMVVFGTLYDYTVVKKMNPPLTKQQLKEQPFFIKALLAFSAYTNGSRVLSTDVSSEQIGCIFGMRFLSMAWIILGHTYYYIARSLTTDNLIPTLIDFPSHWYLQIVVQAPLAVDSFFFLSGLLSTYIFFKKIIKDKMSRSVVSPDIWLIYYIRRYLRLTPVYAFIMWMDVTLFTLVSNGPFWRPIETTGCRHTWWVNLLYLNNFLLQSVECCMGWTWYLANDFQFHVVLTPILVIALSKSTKFGLSLSAALMLVSAIIKLVIMEVHDYPPAPLLTSKLTILEKLDSYWNDVYIKPYVRCAPFICGVVVGYLLIYLTKGKKDTSYPLPKIWVYVGWSLSTVLGLYSVFGLYWYAVTGEIGDWYRILYVIAGRNSFALAISWVTFACATGNGGIVNRILAWKFFTPLGKITFGAYLIHPILLQIYNLSRSHPFHFTNLFQMIRHMFEALIVSYLAAFIIHLLVEAPMQIFENILMEKIMPAPRRPQRAVNGHQQEEEGGKAPERQPLVPNQQQPNKNA